MNRAATFASLMGMGILGCGPRAADAQFQGGRFSEQGGEAIFQNVCQACHMPEAKGAAGVYPALARNAKLEAGGYPIYIVVNGQKAMPALGAMLTDQQIADVVNYVRTHYGNGYSDAVTAADVKSVRP